MRRCLLASLSITFANVAFAHPGHGTGESAGGQSWWHFVSEPIHLLPLLLVAALGFAALRLANRLSAASASAKS